MAQRPDAPPARLIQDPSASDLYALLDPEGRSFSPASHVDKGAGTFGYDDAEPPEEEYQPAVD